MNSSSKSCTPRDDRTRLKISFERRGEGNLRGRANFVDTLVHLLERSELAQRVDIEVFELTVAVSSASVAMVER